MKMKKVCLGFDMTTLGCKLVVLTLLFVGFAVPAIAQSPSFSYQILHTFSGRANNPEATPIVDPSGNLFGTTTGYSGGYGNVYKISATGNYTVLHTFNGTDGNNPYIGTLARDNAGNLYGATVGGGLVSSCGNVGYGTGCGTVYEITSTGKFLPLFRFTGDSDGGGSGALPATSLLLDEQGNLYGTTLYGGTSNYGTVFELSPPSQKGGRWTRTVLYSFQNKADGARPQGGLIADLDDNLFGIAPGGAGGVGGGGTLFELTKVGKLKVVHAFLLKGHNGWYPYGTLAQDTQGNIYGATTYGGDTTYCGDGCGVVFEITKTGTYRQLYLFGQGATDGQYPNGGVILDAYGNLYGTTVQNGNHAGNSGTVFELTRHGNETVLHNFGNSQSDGARLYAGVTKDGHGNLYGATFYGGGTGCSLGQGCGTVFKLSKNAR
jgi:uncharacterized repeat protein (TIGR03803 family)